MRRLLGWRGRMAASIDQLKFLGVDYAAHDCARWAGAHVAALVGVDPSMRWHGAYSDEAGALAVMREAGFDSLSDMVSSVLEQTLGGPCDIHPSQARRGDLAALVSPGPFGVTIGIVDGDRVFAPGPDGMRHASLLEAVRAWRIGDG